MNANAEIIAELRRVLNERDEAREQLDLTKRELGRWVDRETKAVRERDEARTDLARSVAAWESAGMQGRTAHDAMLALAKERDEARAELSKLREDYDSVLEANVGLLDGAPYVDARAAFRRGAEAMREACAKRAWDKIWDAGKRTDNLRKDFTAQAVRDALRALPIPEEP